MPERYSATSIQRVRVSDERRSRSRADNAAEVAVIHIFVVQQLQQSINM